MPNKLDEYIRRNRLTNKLFSDRVAIAMGKKQFSHRTVEQWRTGRAVPRVRAQQAIFKITDGEITPNDFIRLQALP